jgi:hypothetical protein
VIAFLATQVGVCCAWVAVGGGSSIVQLILSIALGVGVWQFLRTWDARAVEEFGPGFLTETVTVTFVLVAMRLARFRLSVMSAAEVPHNAAAVVPHNAAAVVPRSSIRDLLVGTALVAAALATVARMEAMSVTHDASKITSVVGVFLGAITLLSFFSTLAFQRAIIPAAVTCTASLLLGQAVGKAIRYDQVVSIVGLGASAVFQLAVFTPVRLAGYRFARVRNRTT